MWPVGPFRTVGTMNETKKALITGASRGLGLALARSLADDGWTLVLDARGEPALRRAAAELSAGTTVVAIAGDIGEEAHRLALVAAAADVGGLDLVVHNAGTLGPSPLPPLDRVGVGLVAETVVTNAIAPLRLTQLLLPQLRPDAVVVAVTSDAAVEAYEGWGAYGASKAAFEQLFAVLAVEHPELRVLRVDPGDMRTVMHQDAFPGEDITDRPLPEASVPGLRALIEGDAPSGRYQARAEAAVPA